MDAITLLKKQHAEVRELFTEFIKATDDARRGQVVRLLADQLAAHLEIEERFLYPAVFEGELKDVLRMAVEEHLTEKRVVADLLEMEPSMGQYAAKVRVLGELVEHHIKEEHEALFPKVRVRLTSKQIKALGETMELHHAALMVAGPRFGLPFQTKGAASLDGEASTEPLRLVPTGLIAGA